MEAQTSNKKKIIDILKSNSKIVILVIFIFLVSIFTFSWIKYKDDITKTNLSEQYIKAKILLSENKSNQAFDILKNIIEKEDSTYSALALYLIIDQNLENDNRKILNYFDKVLSSNNLKKEDLNLIRFKKGIFISNDGNEKELLDLLNPIINSDSVWRSQALKFIGDYYFSMKEYNKADQYYSILLTLENSNVDINEVKRKIKSYKK
tara:strand:+ start:6774 stop:7394 length:621 start_codon:yes stop_codon:yes gene_type:complete